jgi:hypothetical protein
VSVEQRLIFVDHSSCKLAAQAASIYAIGEFFGPLASCSNAPVTDVFEEVELMQTNRVQERSSTQERAAGPAPS